jgi:hypothetical protein
VAAYAPKGSASLSASYTNLANPGTFDCSLGDAPTWDATSGWIFNGSSNYLKTGITNSSGWSVFVRYSDYISNGNYRYLFGSYGGATAQLRIGLRGTYDILYGNGGELIPSGVTPPTGAILGTAGNKAYRNGTAETGTIGTWSGTGAEIFIGARNNSGPGFYLAGYIQAFAVYNTTISAAQVAALTTSMNAI